MVQTIGAFVKGVWVQGDLERAGTCRKYSNEVGVQKPDRAPATELVLSSGRVASVDALRGFTILLMIFVNDLGPHAPSWMHHIQPPNADGMTLANVVFPAFLFIVGISIPLAIDRGLEAPGADWPSSGTSSRARSVSWSWVWYSSMPTATPRCRARYGVCWRSRPCCARGASFRASEV